MLYIEPFFFPFVAVLILLVPLPWLGSFLFAAAVHELFHIICIKLTGGKIRHIRIGMVSAEIETEIPGYFREMLCALAGPLGSFSLLLLLPKYPGVALCGLIQGLFNLLPVYPLDGGRIIFCILSLAIPNNAERIYGYICELFLIALSILSIFGCIYLEMWVLPILISLYLALIRKKTCKHCGIRIQ